MTFISPPTPLRVCAWSTLCKQLLARLQALIPLITDICRIAGTPGLSLGVLHHGQVVYQANVGFRNVEAELPTDNDTVYMIASLAKPLTAAMVGILVDEGKLDWTTQLQDVVPEFHRQDAAMNITVTDLLSHRTGLPSYDALWLLTDNKILLDRADAISILNYVPAAMPLRTEFVYNNMAYEALSQIIEKASGTDYASFLRDRILEPLGMSQTFHPHPPMDDANVAVPYTALRNATPFQIPQPLCDRNILLGPSGGIRSSVRDMLLLYKAFIDAARAEFGRFATTTVPQNPLKRMKYLWRGMISLSVPTLREYSYASGWFRAQLPAPPPLVYDDGPGINPLIGEGLPSRLALLHGGFFAGFTSWAAVFPETDSAVVVLSNSMPLADTTRLVGQLLIEELFGNTINKTQYIEYVKSTSERIGSYMSRIKSDLLRHKTVETPAYPLQAYVGTYYNAVGNVYIEICETPSGRLRMYFMGSASDGFDLKPYQHNSFFWWMSHDEMAQRSRYTTWPKEYYIIKFEHVDDGSGARGVFGSPINSLRWKHEFAIDDDGELFQKSDYEEMSGLYEQQQSLFG
ncbi:D-aminoacylase, putative [Talaromyces stipitatus ATCC 10500]|uniref:D-aminoacylase, putative n=1 Tax=Talaromyces stipitatus (strain ATCC 10500 / CBS 375.48 / QM 6759 / NRRL 1006) TaxID=441959 RepID=B8MSJ8_TALSN|nr:D-aminoacylase, putative [Talaromyces stipitatus ATCC 10500]EED12078.1 D-aminoacylase, putative [Talaromyces stipitatus ATCC 10500]